MNEKGFISNFRILLKKAVMLAKKKQKLGLSSLEDETEDLDDEDFKQWLRMLIDEVDIAIVDEVMSNKISFIKDKYESRYKAIVKRTVRGIHEGLDGRTLALVLFSLANLPPKEQSKIEYELFDKPYDEPEEESEDEENYGEALITDGLDDDSAEEIKKRLYDFDDVVRLDDRELQKVFRELDSSDLAMALKAAGKIVREKIFRNMSKRAAAMLREDMDYMGQVHISAVQEARQKISDIIRRLRGKGEISGDQDLIDLEG